jgi:hypothetical protein
VAELRDLALQRHGLAGQPQALAELDAAAQRPLAELLHLVGRLPAREVAQVGGEGEDLVGRALDFDHARLFDHGLLLCGQSTRSGLEAQGGCLIIFTAKDAESAKKG